MPQAHCAQRSAVRLRMTDAAAHLLDPDLPLLGQLEVRSLFRATPWMPDKRTSHLDSLPRLRPRTILDRRRLYAALARDLLHRGELAQTVQRGQHHVVRIRGSQALREN